MFSKPVSAKTFLSRKIFTSNGITRLDLIKYFRNKHGAHQDFQIPEKFDPHKYVYISYDTSEDLNKLQDKHFEPQETGVLELSLIQIGYEFLKSFDYHLVLGNQDFIKKLMNNKK